MTAVNETSGPSMAKVAMVLGPQRIQVNELIQVDSGGPGVRPSGVEHQPEGV